MQVGTLHAKVDDTLNTWELHPKTPKFTLIPRETIGCFTVQKVFPDHYIYFLAMKGWMDTTSTRKCSKTT